MLIPINRVIRRVINTKIISIKLWNDRILSFILRKNLSVIIKKITQLPCIWEIIIVLGNSSYYSFFKIIF